MCNDKVDLSNVLLLSFHTQTYVKSQDKQFAAATIQAIGRCATNISEVTDTCLTGLVYLLSNRDGKTLLYSLPAAHLGFVLEAEPCSF